jgi:hypothetical protein
MLAQLLRRALRALGHPPLPVYEVERSDTGPIMATALSIAILGAGFCIDEHRRSLRVTRVGGRRAPALAIVPLPR